MMERKQVGVPLRVKVRSQQGRRRLDLKIKSAIKAGGLMLNHNRALQAY